MTPTKHAQCNTQLGPPPGVSEAECGTLPIRRDEDGMTSYWKPSRMELAILNAGGPVSLRVTGFGHPMVALGVALPELAMPDAALTAKCLRRMVQLMWSPLYEKDHVSTLRELLVSEFEPEVIQQAFAAVGFGREVADTGVPFVPEAEEAGTPLAIMDMVSAHAYHEMGIGPKPDTSVLDDLNLEALVSTMVEAQAQRAQMESGRIRVLPDERLVAAVFTLHRYRLRPQDAHQEVVVNDGEQALVIVRCKKD